MTSVENKVDLGINGAKPLAEATEGDIFQHDVTGAVIVIVENRGRWIEPRDGTWRCDELVTVQLNDGIVEGHVQGWVSILEPDADGWRYVRTAR